MKISVKYRYEDYIAMSPNCVSGKLYNIEGLDGYYQYINRVNCDDGLCFYFVRYANLIDTPKIVNFIEGERKIKPVEDYIVIDDVTFNQK